MGATEDIARFAIETPYEAIGPEVIHEAKRDVINVMSTAIYSARDPSLQYLLDVFGEEGGRERARVWGTDHRCNLQNTALANGYLAHLEDYDDTHFPTVIHPSAPTVPAAFALAEDGHMSGRDFLAAVALGIELCCRMGNAIHPWHYDEGWHITGTMGVFGSAVAAGRLSNLDLGQMVYCLGIAGTQAAGVREVFGSMSKPFHAGRSAQSGLLAALLAKRGFTSTEKIVEGRRGVAAVLSGDRDLSRLTDGLGSKWEIFQNGLKPYSCGVVNHPLIDACIELRGRPGMDLDAIESIDADVHHLVIELVNLPEPRVGLEGKFSVQHCLAIALREGAAYPAQYSDAKVQDAKNIELRRKVHLKHDAAMPEDAGRVTIRMQDGSVHEAFVEHATGAPENPMTDQRLNEKFIELATPTLGGPEAEALLGRLWRLDELSDLNAVWG